MTAFHDWEDVKRDLFAPDEVEAIEQSGARRAAGIRLGELRRRLGLTQREMAERMGVRQERVSAIERGSTETLQVSTLAAYAEALGGQAHVVVEIGGERLTVA